MSSIPYLSTPGAVSEALSKIQVATTPEKVTADFINTKLGIKKHNVTGINSLLRKMNFIDTVGKPTPLYRNFKAKTHSGEAIAKGIKSAYADIYAFNEYLHDIDDEEFKKIIIDNFSEYKDNTIKKIIYTFNHLKKFADFDTQEKEENIDQEVYPNIEEEKIVPQELSNQYNPIKHNSSSIGMNLSYTINLNLPATNDPSVFNAIFRSLRENLLKDEK